MRIIRLLFLPLLTLSLLASCGGSSGGGGGQQREEDTTGETAGGTSGGTTGGNSNFDVTLDSALTRAERISVNNSIDLLEKLKLDGSRISGFSQIFGGNRSSNVVNYLERRVNYIISQFTTHGSRLLLPTPPAVINLETFASNSSALLWYFDRYYAQEGGARYVISDRPRDINSSLFGVVKLGDIFTTSDAITQAITLVHEARHSDCPGGAVLSDIVNFVESNVIPQNKKCGQLHTTCSGNSCDGIPWGPYAIDFIYSLTIFETCSNCSEIQRLQALSNANQVQGAAFDINGTMNGVYGRPNMSTSTQVRNDL